MAQVDWRAYSVRNGTNQTLVVDPVVTPGFGIEYIKPKLDPIPHQPPEPGLPWVAWVTITLWIVCMALTAIAILL